MKNCDVIEIKINKGLSIDVHSYENCIYDINENYLMIYQIDDKDNHLITPYHLKSILKIKITNNK